MCSHSSRGRVTDLIFIGIGNIYGLERGACQHLYADTLPLLLQTAELQATIEAQRRQLEELHQAEDDRQREAADAAARLLCSDEVAQNLASLEPVPEPEPEPEPEAEPVPVLSLAPRLLLPAPSRRTQRQWPPARGPLSLWPDKPPETIDIGGHQVMVTATFSE